MREFWKLTKAELPKLVKLNLVFMLFCLPILTIPVAICALNEVLARFWRDKEFKPFSDFRRAFRDGFWGYCRIGYAGVLPFIVCIWMIAYLYPQAKTSAWNAVFFGTNCILMGFLMAASVFYFPMAGGVELSFRAMVKNAFLLGILYAKKAMPAALLVSLIYVAEFRLLPYTAPIVALVGVSLPALLSICVAWPDILAKVIVPPPETPPHG